MLKDIGLVDIGDKEVALKGLGKNIMTKSGGIPKNKEIHGGSE